MPLNEAHKTIIEATIQHLFDFVDGNGDRLNEAGLQAEVRKINEALLNDVNEQHDYFQLRMIYNDPATIVNITNQGYFTIGEARNAIIEYVIQKYLKSPLRLKKLPYNWVGVTLTLVKEGNVIEKKPMMMQS